MPEHDTTTAERDATPAEDTTMAGGPPEEDPGLAGDPTECDRPWCGAGPPPGSLTSRLMISTESLTAHPGNVREDLDLDAEFLASIAENGVLVPLRITLETDDQGEAIRYRVIDGHRRLAAAIKAGHAEVPYDLVIERQGDEAGQYLDMYNAHHHRKDLTVREEVGALFAAHQAGASKTRIRKATGLKAPQVKAALAAATLSDENHAALTDGGYDLNLEELAILAEFQDDPQALNELAQVIRWQTSLEHAAQRLRLQREERAEHERLRAELEAVGLTLTDTLPPGAELLTNLRHDDEPLTAEAHAGCPGHAAYFTTYDLATPRYYCTTPGAHGHEPIHVIPEHTPGAATGPASSPGQPADSGPAADPSADRRLVMEGNRAWKAGGEVRHLWLGQLFSRRTAPREVAPFVARMLLRMPDPLRTSLAIAHSCPAMDEVTGHTDEGWLEICDTAGAGRLPLLLLAPIVAAFEIALTEGEGKNTWRTGRYSPCPTSEAGRYFTFLASLGYELSAIEQAVADGEPYAGETPSDTLTVRAINGPEPSAGDDGTRDQDVSADVRPDGADIQDAAQDVLDSRDVSDGSGRVPEQAAA